jgi:hypothetical protein
LVSMYTCMRIKMSRNRSHWEPTCQLVPARTYEVQQWSPVPGTSYVHTVSQDTERTGVRIENLVTATVVGYSAALPPWGCGMIFL